MTSENHEKDIHKVGPEYFSLQTPGGEIEAVHVRPYGDPKATIVYGIGWNSTIELQKPMMQRLSAIGYDVVSMTPPKALTPLERRTHLVFPTIEEHKAEGILAILDYVIEEGTSHVNLVLNSEAGIYGTIAALIAQHDPKLPTIDNLILVAPAGLVEGDKPHKLLRRFFVDERIKRLVKGDLQLVRKSVRGGKEQTKLLKLIHELMAISSTPTKDVLKYLYERGVHITIISPKDDKVFPQKDLKAAAEYIGADFMSIDGTHRAIYTHTTSVISRIDEAIEKHAQ